MSELTAKLDEYYAKDDFFSIIKTLEEIELDYTLALYLARAYINASNKTSDGFELLNKANIILDNFALSGKDDPNWLFFKGYTLFKQGLVPDSIMRFERALNHVSIGSNAKLLSNINTMLQLCKEQMIESEFKGVNEQDNAILAKHIETHFGVGTRLATIFKVEVIHIPPHEGHDYNLLVTKGLSARKLNVPAQYDEKSNSHLELCLALPAKYEFKRDKDRNWPVYLLLDLIEMVISTKDFIGFGYYINNEKPFSKATYFNGALLTALGDYDGESQSTVLSDGSLTHFFQVVPLLPLETLYRSSHTALELLNMFKQRQIPLTPLYENRPDVCEELKSAQV